MPTSKQACRPSKPPIPPSPAEPHVTTAGRRLSLIGERANAPAWMGRTDGGHLFAKKPPDRERGRREEGEKTLVQWHEFRYDYRCKAGCCCSGTCSCAAGSASDSEEFTCKGCYPASAQNDCPTPSSMRPRKGEKRGGRKGA